MKNQKNKLVIASFYYLSLAYAIFLLALFIYNLYNYLTIGELTYTEDGKYIVQEFGNDIVNTPVDMFDEMEIRSIVRLILLSVYFFIVSLTFKHITVDSIFSKKSIRILTFFGILNFIPFLYALISNIILWGESWVLFDAFYRTSPYLVAGLFSLFIASIFKQGFILKQENDLTI